jgi:phosphoribosylanthranilate isomerase
MRALLHDRTFVLAGGLAPRNVARAIALLAPDVVDVSSGVESIVGQKSAGSVHEFVQIARSAGIEQEAGRDDR